MSRSPAVSALRTSQEVGGDLADQAIGLGGHGSRELRAEAVDLGADGHGVAVVAVQEEGELFGGQAAGVGGQQGQDLGVAQGRG